MERYATIIISYRRPDLLTLVLERLAEQTIPPELILVVDNGGDLASAVVEQSTLAARTVLVRRPDNPGYAAAVNEARPLVESRGISHLLVLTHDAVFGRDLAADLAGAFEVPRRGAAAPLLQWASNPDRVFSAGGRLTRGGRAWNTTTPESASAPYDVDWVDGAIVMYRTAALREIDWLDERYFLYFEDVDTSWRLRRAGWATVVVPTARGRQQPGTHPMYLGVRNMTLFARSVGVPTWRSGAAVARRVAEESIFRLLHGKSPAVRDAWRGWRDGRRGLTGQPEAAHA